MTRKRNAIDAVIRIAGEHFMKVDIERLLKREVAQQERLRFSLGQFPVERVAEDG